MTGPAAWPAARLFDGVALHSDCALLVEGGSVTGLCPAGAIPPGFAVQPTAALIAPGFIDLQVNGGGGVMLNEAASVGGLSQIAGAHRAAGTTGLLPTLVTDTPDVTAAAVEAVVAAVAEGVQGILGLHLEGPHFSPARKGAHRLDLLRPMGAADLRFLLDAAARVPVLMVTLSPEVVTPAQVAALTEAGVIVSLGHSDSGFEACRAAADAGARCVTHLYNAMSQLAGRSPGLVGAALALPGLHAGLIADGHHVHPAAMAVAARCLMPEARLFLVTDAMAPFGTEDTRFLLNGRTVLRGDGQLRLEDGTLAGADITLPRAVSLLMRHAGVDLAAALATVTAVPARLIGLWPRRGSLMPGSAADFLCLTDTLGVAQIVLGGGPA